MIRKPGTTWQNLGGWLSRRITDSKRGAWLSAPLEEWANESLRIALSPQVGYTDLQSGFQLDREYWLRNRETVAERLSAAGVRLGSMLNHLLDE